MARTGWRKTVATAVATIFAAVGTGIALPAAADAQSAQRPSPEIVVTAVRSRPSGWRQAETSHIVLLGEGSEADLVRIARNLERLHFLLSGLLGRSEANDDVVKIRITLIGEAAEFENMGLHSLRWQQGPYNDLFQISRYYDPREDGAVMASTRVDQRVVVEHTSVNARSVAALLASGVSGDPSARAEMFAAIGSLEMSAWMQGPHDVRPTFGEKAIEVSAESLIYSGYAQHYLLTYFPAAYPRWYLDGFGQIFGALRVPGENALEFGRAPSGAATVMHEFGPYPIKDVLDDSYLSQKPHKTGWTPVHAWMLTHFLFFSDKRRPQLRQYLAARANGASAASAAAVFGDQKELARELRAYHASRKPYLQVTYDGSKIEQPLVRRLSQGEAAFVKGRLELGARVVIPAPPPPDAGPAAARAIARAREAAIARRDHWLEGLRRDEAKWSGEVDSHLLLAEAECRSGHADLCLAAAARAELVAPGDSRALAWKAAAMVEQAEAAPATERPARIAAARQAIVKANQADPEAVEPLLAYYASFARVGEQPSATAIDGVQKAMEEVPSAPSTRLELATALARNGRTDAARQVIMPVAAGPYDSPERPAAQALIGSTQPAAAASGGGSR